MSVLFSPIGLRSLTLSNRIIGGTIPLSFAHDRGVYAPNQWIYPPVSTYTQSLSRYT